MPVGLEWWYSNTGYLVPQSPLSVAIVYDCVTGWAEFLRQ